MSVPSPPRTPHPIPGTLRGPAAAHAVPAADPPAPGREPGIPAPLQGNLRPNWGSKRAGREGGTTPPPHQPLPHQVTHPPQGPQHPAPPSTPQEPQPWGAAPTALPRPRSWGPGPPTRGSHLQSAPSACSWAPSCSVRSTAASWATIPNRHRGSGGGGGQNVGGCGGGPQGRAGGARDHPFKGGLRESQKAPEGPKRDGGVS